MFFLCTRTACTGRHQRHPTPPPLCYLLAFIFACVYCYLAVTKYSHMFCFQCHIWSLIWSDSTTEEWVGIKDQIAHVVGRISLSFFENASLQW